MKPIKLAETIDRHFPQPKGNRGFNPFLFLQTFIMKAASTWMMCAISAMTTH
ncbi:MAG: hypothetical protein RPT25_10775 [Cycloclasticus sp.]